MAIEFDTGYSRVYYTWTYPAVISVSLWYVHLGDKVTVNRLFGMADDFEIKMNVSDHKFVNELFKGTGTSSTAGYTAGTWMHIVCTANQSSGAGTMYINGALDNSTTGHTAVPTNPNYLAVGGRYGATEGQEAGGILEDVRIYNRILSAQEVKVLYDCDGSDRINDGLIDRWILPTIGGAGSVGVGGDNISWDQGHDWLNVYSGDAFYWGGRKKYRCRA